MHRNKLPKIFSLQLILLLLMFVSCDSRERNQSSAINIEENHAKDLDIYLQRLLPFGFSGAVLVAEGDDILLNKGYGLAVDSGNIPNTNKTVFSIGSITKSFTSVAIYKLHQQGKLSIDDPITEYFDNVPEAFRPITIHQLLTHTSGMAPYTGGDFQQQTREEMVRIAFRRGLDFPPGEGYTYSNSGYSVLAAIVEKVSDQSYEEFLREQILLPAGMKHTGYQLPDWDDNTFAHYYTNGSDNGTMLKKEGFPQWTILGNGGLHSTTKDMFKFHRALMGSNILSEETKERMYAVQRGPDASGWQVSESPHGKVISHTGGSSIGVAAVFRRYVEKDIVIVTFANRDGDDVVFNSGLSDKIEKMVFGKKISIPPAITRASKNFKKYEGRYELSDSDYYEMTQAADRLEVHVFGQKAINALLPKDSEYADTFNVTTSKTKELLEAFTEKDSTIVKKYASYSPDRYYDIIQSKIENASTRFGAFKGFTILGTVADHYTDFGDYMSFIQMNFENGNSLFRFHWAEGKVKGVGGFAFPEPMLFSLIPEADGTWKGYHIGMELPIKIRFGSDGNPDELIILSSNERTQFTKSPSKNDRG